jgi:hypothetical protein
MLVQEINYNKTKKKFLYIQKEFQEIFKLYFDNKNLRNKNILFSNIYNKTNKLSNYVNIDFLNSINDLTISYDYKVEEMNNIIKYKFSLINDILKSQYDNNKDL